MEGALKGIGVDKADGKGDALLGFLALGEAAVGERFHSSGGLATTGDGEIELAAFRLRSPEVLLI